jgi:hypothetical protein
MDLLAARAQEPAYKANPAALAGLKETSCQQVKDERDSYYRVREAGIPGNVPTEKIPGKEDLLKGKGRSYYEDQKKNSEAGPLDQKLQRLKVQARRQFPRAHTDDEALVLKLLDKETQDDRENRRVDARQDAELAKNFALDREQDDEIDNLQTQASVKEHGGGIGPKQRWQDLMPEQSNPEDYDDYEDEDEDLRLRSGDYVRDTQDGESGEVFRMQGDPYERRVRILDRDGRGWYIEPSRLTRVDPQDPDVQRYFGKKRVRDMDEMDKSQPSQERHGDRALGAKGTTATPVAARKVVKDLAMDFDQAFAKQKPVKKKGVAEAIPTIRGTPKAQPSADYTGEDLVRDANALFTAGGFKLADKEVEPRVDNPKKINTTYYWRKKIKGLTPDQGQVQQLMIEIYNYAPNRTYWAINDWANDGARVTPDLAQKLWRRMEKTIKDSIDTAERENYWYSMIGNGKKPKGLEEEDVAEGFTDTLKFAWRELKTNVVDFVANAVGLPNDQRREVFVRAGNEFSNEVIKLLATHPARDKLIPMVREIGGYMAKARTLEELKSLLDKAGLFLADVDAGKFNPPGGVAKPLPGHRDNQGVAEGKADYNFDAEDLKRLERIRDLPTLKTQALALISRPSAKPMKPEKVEWFKNALDRMNSPIKVIKLMYDLLLSGEGHAVVGSRSSMNPNSYRQRFGEQGMAEAVDEKGALKSAQAAAKFIIRNLDDRAALKDYSMHFWSPEKFYQGATMAMRGAGFDEIVKQITQDRPAQFEEGWSDAVVARRTGQPRTPYAVYIKGKKWKDFENEDLAQAVANKLKAKFKADGRDPETITIAPADMSEGLKSTLAGAALAGAMALGGAGAAQAQSAASGSSMPNATTIIQQIQAGKIQNQNDLSAALGDNQSIQRFVFKQLQAKAGLPGHGADSVINALAKKSTAGAQQPGAQQPVKSAGQSGSIVQRPTDNFESRIKEEQDSSGVERAILNRIMVAHTDLLMKFGPDKVMQAAEEVAYNVGDVDEIGTSDVSAYVAQVKQILGATP